MENNVKTTTTKDKAKQLQRQIFQTDKCKEHSKHITIYRENMNFYLLCDNPGDLICCDTCPSSFNLKYIGVKKKDDVGTSKDIRKNHHDVTFCQVYDKECENIGIISNWKEEIMRRETSTGIFNCLIEKIKIGLLQKNITVLIIKRKSGLILAELATKTTRK